MVNKFAVIGVTGIIVSAVCLSGAVLLGGQALSQSGFDFDGWGKPRCDSGDDHTLTTRQIGWDGSDRIEVDMPSDVHYHTGQGTMLEIKGPPNVVSQARLRNGKITLGCRRSYNVDITLPGRIFHEFVFHGAGDVNLEGIDQPDLKITMMGAGDFKAGGKAGHIDVTMMGVGDMHMGDLAAGSVKLTMMGAGDAEVSPIDRLNVTSMGAGDVTLRREPREIESHIMGAGEIIHAAGGNSRQDDSVAPAAPDGKGI